MNILERSSNIQEGRKATRKSKYLHKYRRLSLKSILQRWARSCTRWVFAQAAGAVTGAGEVCARPHAHVHLVHGFLFSPLPGSCWGLAQLSPTMASALDQTPSAPTLLA